MKSTTYNYRHIIEQIEDYAILLLDENGIIEDWNKGAEKLKGYKAVEIIGKSFNVFYTAEDRASKLPEQLIAKAITNGKASDEGLRVCKNGITFWGSILITALFDEKNKLTGFLKITRNLTEKKQLEEKLLRLNEGLELEVKERTAEI
ncbi:MAG: PAS domain S-box protein [Bacteroidetes bacterium]|nr:PAS domain S-box protein [Bacteroidota bacterium]